MCFRQVESIFIPLSSCQRVLTPLSRTGRRGGDHAAADGQGIPPWTVPRSLKVNTSERRHPREGGGRSTDAEQLPCRLLQFDGYLDVLFIYNLYLTG